MIEDNARECGVLEARGRKCLLCESSLLLNIVNTSIKEKRSKIIGFVVVKIIDVRAKTVLVSWWSESLSGVALRGNDRSENRGREYR